MSVVDPFKLAKQQQTLVGTLALATLPRANQSLALPQGEVNYILSFAIDEMARCVIRGNLQANYWVECQRCLQTFVQSMVGDFVVSPVVQDSEAKTLPPIYEPVILANGMLDVVGLIEDEFILAMPIVPMHADGTQECVEIENKELQEEPNNPFQVLQKLKSSSVNKEGHQTEDK